MGVDGWGGCPNGLAALWFGEVDATVEDSVGAVVPGSFVHATAAQMPPRTTASASASAAPNRRLVGAPLITEHPKPNAVIAIREPTELAGIEEASIMPIQARAGAPAPSVRIEPSARLEAAPLARTMRFRPA